MSDSPTYCNRTVRLRSDDRVTDTVVMEVTRLLEYLNRNGVDITNGDIRIRKAYDPSYLADELVITWDKR